MQSHFQVSLKPSLLHSEQLQVSQPVFVGEVLHPWDHFCSPPLDVLHQVRISYVLRTPGETSRTQSRGVGSPLLPYWPRFFWCSPACNWLSGLRIAGSWPVFPSSFQQGCTQFLHLPASTDGSDFHLRWNTKMVVSDAEHPAGLENFLHIK